MLFRSNLSRRSSVIFYKKRHQLLRSDAFYGVKEHFNIDLYAKSDFRFGIEITYQPLPSKIDQDINSKQGRQKGSLDIQQVWFSCTPWLVFTKGITIKLSQKSPQVYSCLYRILVDCEYGPSSTVGEYKGGQQFAHKNIKMQFLENKYAVSLYKSYQSEKRSFKL